MEVRVSSLHLHSSKGIFPGIFLLSFPVFRFHISKFVLVLFVLRLLLVVVLSLNLLLLLLFFRNIA